MENGTIIEFLEKKDIHTVNVQQLVSSNSALCYILFIYYVPASGYFARYGLPAFAGYYARRSEGGA
jgi:hypothetical protein